MTKNIVVTRGRVGGRVRPQLQREQSNAFNREKKELFLTTLATTANVAHSMLAAGITSATLYRTRQKDAAFRAAWMTALDEGYERLELMLLDRAINGAANAANAYASGFASGSEAEGGPVRAAPEFSNGDAMRLLKLHRDAVQSRRAHAGAFSEETSEEIRLRIEAKLLGMGQRLRDEGDT